MRAFQIPAFQIKLYDQDGEYVQTINQELIHQVSDSKNINTLS